jgi:hypothetical protein
VLTTIGALFSVTVNTNEYSSAVTPSCAVKVGSTITIDVSNTFEDPEGAALTYSVTNSDDQILSAVVSGSTISLTGLSEGAAEVTVFGIDDINASASESFDVTVESSDEELLFDLSGRVTAGGAAFVNGSAVLTDVADVSNSISTPLSSNGGFAFSFISEGEYTLYVTSSSADYVTTFFGNVSKVLDANAVPELIMVNKNVTGADIQMLDKPEPAVDFKDEETGGTVNFTARSSTDDTGSRIVQGNVSSGEVLPNVLIILNTANDRYVADGVTDSKGNIRFTGLPTANYKLIVEVPGVGRVSQDIAVQEGESAVFTGLISENGVVFEDAITGLTDPFAEVRMYPTLATDELVLELPQSILSNEYSLRIMSVSGQLFEPTVDRRNSILNIDLSNYKSGVYIITIQNNGEIWSRRFIKQ